jgi:superfamily II RNA helicase
VNDRVTLGDRIPKREHLSTDLLLERFLAYVKDAGLELYPAQEEAILALLEGHHVILATPTGSGKSLVAAAMHFISLGRGERTYYTAPIKALVSEKFFALSADLGAERVGLMTGDASVNRDADVIACTAEILAKVTLREGAAAKIGSAVMDEFHFYGDRDRGVAWQIPLLGLPKTQFLLMSATLGDTRAIEEDLEARTGRQVTVIRTMERPVPLEREYAEVPLHETLRGLIDAQRAPVYVVHFTQRGAAEHAQELLSTEVVSKEQKQRIKERLHGFRFDTPFGKDLGRFVRHGVAVHHAGLLPKYRRLVEKLAQEGLLAVICGTDTLGVGVNVPIRSVLFTQLCKYDGNKTAVLTVRDFQQIAGRAGRRGFDTKGWVVAQAPEHMVENRTLRMKAEGDAKKMKKLVVRKPPEKGYAHWDGTTFERLATGTPETLEPRFTVTQGMVLEVVSGAWDRHADGLRELLRLIKSSHVARKHRFTLARRAISIVRSFLERGVLVVAAEKEGGRERRVLAPSSDLQLKFALNQGLSLFAVDVIDVLEPESPTYALDVLSVIEATLEDPDQLLYKLLDEKKKEKLDAMKAEGIPFEERMAELEKIVLDRPLEPLLLQTLEVFTEQHPWVAKEELRPKKIARDVFERGAGFSDYVRDLGLARSEGLLLRYLSDAYKGLVQNVPEGKKTEDLLDLEGWLGAVVRGVDSSLLDEWQRLARGEVTPEQDASPELPPDVTRDVRGFAVMVRNASHRLVRALARRRYDDAATMVVAPTGAPEWVGRRIEEAMQPFRAEHAEILLDATSRAATSCLLARDAKEIRVTQMLRDPEDDNDFHVDLRVDLEASREAGAPVLELIGIAR